MVLDIRSNFQPVNNFNGTHDYVNHEQMQQGFHLPQKVRTVSMKTRGVGLRGLPTHILESTILD